MGVRVCMRKVCVLEVLMHVIMGVRICTHKVCVVYLLIGAKMCITVPMCNVQIL